MLDKMVQDQHPPFQKDSCPSPPIGGMSRDRSDFMDMSSESDVDVLDLYNYEDDHESENEDNILMDNSNDAGNFVVKMDSQLSNDSNMYETHQNTIVEDNKRTTNPQSNFKVISHSVSVEFKNNNLLVLSNKYTNDLVSNNNTDNPKEEAKTLNRIKENLFDHIKLKSVSENVNNGDVDNLGIDESILELIAKLGNDMNIENGVQMDVLPELTALNSSINDNPSLPLVNYNPHNNHHNVTNFDLLSIQLSSDDENYNEHERFDMFFNLDGNISSRDSPLQEQADIDIETTVNEIFGAADETVVMENETFGNIHDSQISLPSAFPILPPDDPPPYSEFDNCPENTKHFYNDLEEQIERSISNTSANLQLLSPTTETSPTKSTSSSNSQNSPSPCSTLPTTSLKDKLSVKLKRSSGELSRKTSVDYYQMDRYLLPYRSLINPNKVYDYRTNSYIDTNKNGIEIKPHSNNKTVVSIYKKKKSDNKLMSMLITTNNSLKQKLLDASDTLSIKSIKSIISYKATAKFKDLSMDIRKRIIGLIDNQRDLVNCLYVSKSFQEFAIPNLYKYPKFTSTYRLGQFIYTIMNNEKLASCVRTLDLSKITYPVDLTPFEIQKYNGKLTYGSSISNDLLKDKSRHIYASWRDWKYRKHPLYGDLKNTWRRRANSSSTISSDSTLVRINSSLSSTSNKSTPNLLKSNNSSITLVNSKTRSNSVATSESNGSKTRKRSNSSNDLLKKNNKNTVFNTYKNKLISVPKNSSGTTIKSKGIKKNVDIEGTPQIKVENIPFRTPHPKMNSLLKRYCFNKDIPVGYIIHILKECKYLHEIDFSGITISTDYELLDYETFDWALCTGKSMNYGKSPKLIDPERPIFSSDIGDEIEFNDKIFINGFVKAIELKNIWDIIMNLKGIEILKLRKINWLEQSIILNFVMNSNFANNLKYLDCSSSGMVKRDEWDKLRHAAEWKDYFQTV